MRNWLLGCLCVCVLVCRAAGNSPCLYATTEVKIEGYDITVDDAPFYAQGVGYSPVPSDSDLAHYPNGDYFTSNYKNIWMRDIELMRGMNVTLIRVWSWNFMADHKLFLDTLWNSGNRPIRILVPFLMSVRLYKDLTNPSTRAQVIIDFRAFLKYTVHPAIFGYMIGNELDREYGENIDDLFALVNQMIKFHRKLNANNTLPVTLPLSAESFEHILQRYYEWLAVDFWSIQVYSVDAMVHAFDLYFTTANASSSQKPLLVTELGADAVNFDTLREDQTEQVVYVEQLLAAVDHYRPHVFGGLIMEWCDEWWKGDVPDVMHDNCPDRELSEHQFCGSYISNNTFIFEEWLGIFAQESPKIGWYYTEYCIVPRKLYHLLVQKWGGQPDSMELCIRLSTKDPKAYIFAPVLGLFIVWLGIEIIHRKKREISRKTLVDESNQRIGKLLQLLRLHENGIAHAQAVQIPPEKQPRMLYVQIQFFHEQIQHSLISIQKAVLQQLHVQPHLRNPQLLINIQSQMDVLLSLEQLLDHPIYLLTVIYVEKSPVMKYSANWRQSSVQMSANAVQLQKALKQVEQLQNTLNEQEKSLAKVKNFLPEQELLNVACLSEDQTQKVEEAMKFLHLRLLEHISLQNKQLSALFQQQQGELKNPKISLEKLHDMQVHLNDQALQLHLQKVQIWSEFGSKRQLFHEEHLERNTYPHIKQVLTTLTGVMLRKYISVAHIDEALEAYKTDVTKDDKFVFAGDAFSRLKDVLGAPDTADATSSMRDHMTAISDFHIVRLRIEHLIWDKILSSETAVLSEYVYAGSHYEETDVPLLTKNIDLVHHRYMEGYNMWLQRRYQNYDKTKKAELHWVDKLEELVLWNIVAQCAGTINHSPEKVCEVFEFVQQHVRTLGVPRRLVSGLLSIFAQYYKEVESHRVNFEDVNGDSVKPHESKVPREQRETEKSILLSYDNLSEHEVSLKDRFFAGCKCVTHNVFHGPNPKPDYGNVESGKNTCEYVTPGFPQRGGIFGALVTYGWLIRIHMWILYLAWLANYLQGPAMMCFESTLPYLAIGDSGFSLLVNSLRFHVVGKLRKTHAFMFLWSFLWTTALSVVVMAKRDNLPFSLPPAMLNYLPVGYVGATLVIFVAIEVVLVIRPACFPVKGRENDERLERMVQVGFWIGFPSIAGILVFVLNFALLDLVPALDPILSYNLELLTLILGINVNAAALTSTMLALAGGAWLGHILAKMRLKGSGDLADSETQKWKEGIFSETKYLVWNVFFWMFVLGIYWVAVFHFLVPSVMGITSELCSCEEGREAQLKFFTETIHCSQRVEIICGVAVGLTWTGALLVSLVASNACFTLVMIVAGVFIAIYNRIGDIKEWQHIPKHFTRLRLTCFPFISECLNIDKNQAELWNHFIDSLFEEYLITSAERASLKVGGTGVADSLISTAAPDLSRPPRNKEAVRRIIKFCWSLEAMAAKGKGAIAEDFRRMYQVRCMPSWTVMVPVATETTFYSQSELLRPKDNPRISIIEYLVATFSDEWDNFARSLRVGQLDGKKLLEMFLASPVYENSANIVPPESVCSEREVDKICMWASCRGQTLYRTIRGLINYREGLIKVAELEEGIKETTGENNKQRIKKSVEELVSRKFQIIIALQIYKPERLTDDWTAPRKAAFERMLRFMITEEGHRHNSFDIVYNGDETHSRMIRFDGKNLDIRSAEVFTVTRPGKLIVGEPKADNQNHALAFALNEVLQTNDMNMYNTLENAFKIPYLLNVYFNVPDGWKKKSSVIPQYRIVGFPEHTYTRSLSTVGELMGSAEFCFVTLTQRVLASLRVRLHYGHPDFFDGYWVRTRGGVSKASHLVNTNEDIYSGYEMVGRGERIAYVEFIEQEKGRESGFNEAFTFEAKLAQGAAQQIRSREVYHLNNGLPLFMRLSMFYGSVGFYISSMLMDISIDFYMFAILLFAASGVNSDALGLLKAVMAVPWMFQIGYVNCLPLLVELIINYGFWAGVVHFLVRLPLSLIFFVFHLRTKSYFFTQGLLVGKGGYKGTGRGFGLDRMSLVDIFKCYYDSHFHNAFVLLAAVCFYRHASEEVTAAFFLRTASILLVVFSWITAPMIFNPYATSESLNKDVKSISEWIATDFSRKTLYDPVLHIANAEMNDAKRKDLLNRWIVSKNSWQAWFIKLIIDEWEEEDRWFSHVFLSRVKQIIQKVINLIWRYFPWFVFGQYYWRTHTVDYLFVMVACTLFMGVIDSRYTNPNEHFTIWKACIFVCLPSTFVYFIYGNVTFSQLLVSTMLYMMTFHLVCEWSLGIYNWWISRSKKKTSWEGEMDDTRELLVPRLSVPRFLAKIQRIWPYITVMLLSFVELLTVIFSGGLTTLLFNGRVADMWHRAYLSQK